MNTLAHRYRIPLIPGLTDILDQKPSGLSVAAFSGPAGTTEAIQTNDHECALTLVHGTVLVEMEGERPILLGPRPDPFTHMAHALLVSGHKKLRMTAKEPTLVIIASSPAGRAYPTQVIRPSDVRVSERGEQNWCRQVRLVCWSDNTQGEQLLIGETVTPSGNWSSVPPHRHQEFVDGDEGPLEVPYEEAYFFRFSRPQGFALSRHFDIDESVDQSITIRSGDLLHVKQGYHPVVCAPGASFYHLTMMAGPHRRSAASIHPDYRFLVGDKETNNPFRNQEQRTLHPR